MEKKWQMGERKGAGRYNHLHFECSGSGVSKKTKNKKKQLKLKPQVLERSTITTDLQTVKK
jgi:hypothetical protein